MAKPSIFSKDYERLMKKRRRKIILSILALILVGSSVSLYIANGGINFSEIRGKLQAWVDSGKSPEEEDTLEASAPVIEEPQKEEPKEIFFETKLGENDIKVSLNVAEDNSKTFNEIVSGGEFTVISPDKTKLLALDANQNMLLINVNDEKSNITKENYVSTTGSVYSKETILQQYDGYVWHKTPRFLSDEKIAFVSNLPYFGAGISQYIWTYNINTGEFKTNWNIKGSEISLGDLSEKGLEFTIDGKIKYITPDESVVE